MAILIEFPRQRSLQSIEQNLAAPAAINCITERKDTILSELDKLGFKSDPTTESARKTLWDEYTSYLGAELALRALVKGH